MRYANQPMSELEKMPMEDIVMWCEEVAELIAMENATGSRSEEDIED